ncbi:MAG: hypothetical protein RL403_1974 [Bacteroidota bacterium]|jgi:hypothetical protein
MKIKKGLNVIRPFFYRILVLPSTDEDKASHFRKYAVDRGLSVR